MLEHCQDTVLNASCKQICTAHQTDMKPRFIKIPLAYLQLEDMNAVLCRFQKNRVLSLKLSEVSTDQDKYNLSQRQNSLNRQSTFSNQYILCTKIHLMWGPSSVKEENIYIYIYTHTHIYIYIYIYTHTHIYFHYVQINIGSFTLSF